LEQTLIKAQKKLDAELQDIDDELANEICVDEWSIKDLMAVRLWWTRNVLDWVDKGRNGVFPKLPAAGYSWKETPRLNANTVQKSRDRTFTSIVASFHSQYSRLLATIHKLNDDEFLKTEVFEWTGKYPISRWLSMNTVRQYHTARTLIRRTRKR